MVFFSLVLVATPNFRFILLFLQMQIVEDLHAARNDKWIVLPVVQACGELTSMEIDLPNEESNQFSSKLSCISGSSCLSGFHEDGNK